MSKLSIVLADDHHVVRDGLRALLERHLDAIVEEAATGPEAVTLVEQLHPNLLVVDLMLPGINGLDVTRRVRQVSPRTHVVMLTMHADVSYVREALRAGVTGYVLKDALSADFLYALQQAARGMRYLSPSLIEHAIDAYIQQDDEQAPDAYASLTLREREVLYHVAQGSTSAEIAACLNIGVRTVDWHRTNLMHKLGLHGTAELVRYAMQKGIIASYH